MHPGFSEINLIVWNVEGATLIANVFSLFVGMYIIPHDDSTLHASGCGEDALASQDNRAVSRPRQLP